MAIVVKRVHGREYAYRAFRSGKRIIQMYLGALANPKVQQLIKEEKKSRLVPRKFRLLFWDTDLSNIGLRQHSAYVIERILSHGSYDAFRWLEWVYPSCLIFETIQTSRRISDPCRSFWNTWFTARDKGEKGISLQAILLKRLKKGHRNTKGLKGTASFISSLSPARLRLPGGI